MLEHPSSWYDREPPDGNAIAPYTLVGIKVTGEVREALSAAFFPFVGPLDPEKRWKAWEDCFVYCEFPIEVTVVDCEATGLRVRWTLFVEDEDLFTACWTVHPLSHKPLIIAAGATGVIYVIDAVAKAVVRTLKGHGGSVYAVRAHPAHPHVVASASQDNTVRLWDILGSDSPAWGGGGEENYAMGRAAEGGCVLAIVGGAKPGGHADGVLSLDFHPTRQLLATSGGDRRVKIWPLPPFPPPSALPDTTLPRCPPRISFPLFSTKRLHRLAVASVHWLSDHVLASRDNDEVALWRWTGMDRCLDHDELIAPNDYVRWQDMTESHMFEVVARYATPDVDHYWRMPAVHYPFRSLGTIRQEAALVNAPLLAVPVVEGDSGLVVHLYNLRLAQAPPPSPFPPYLGATAEAVSEGDSQRDVDMKSDGAPGDGSGDVEAARATGQHAHAPPAVSPNKPWRLVASDWRRVAAGDPLLEPLGTRAAPSVIRAVAISPRGAKYIVAVGDGGCVLMWKRKDGTGEQ